MMERGQKFARLGSEREACYMVLSILGPDSDERHALMHRTVALTKEASEDDDIDENNRDD